MAKTVKRYYEGWIVDPDTKGHSLVARGTNRKQCWLDTAFSAGKRGATKFFIEDPKGKKEWFEKPQ